MHFYDGFVGGSIPLIEIFLNCFNKYHHTCAEQFRSPEDVPSDSG